MEDGAPCGVDEVARRMSVSVRTLQRRLADWGTTWSAQLDEIRCRRAREADLFANPSMQSLAARLGYSDVRSVRRAMRRWKDVTSIDSHH
jgi:transcriptional regulator GlxA family with amidase domain